MYGTKFESLPDDLLFEVISHLSVPDILRLRQVSRPFRALTCERTIWVNAYRDSTILRPPGPFLSQSATHLEQELKNSMKLEANWTSTSPQPVSQRTLNLGDDMKAERLTLILGRYLLVIGSDKLRCYDLDSGDERPIASYNLPVRFQYLDTVVDSSVDDREREYAPPLSIRCALLAFSTEDFSNMMIMLLDLHISYGTARFERKSELHLHGEVLAWFHKSRHDTLMGNFLLIDNCSPKVLHIPTCKFYHLPPRDFELTSRVCILSALYLLVHTRGTESTLEVFSLPDDVPESAQTNTLQTALLTRSHFAFLPFLCINMLSLSSHTTHTHSSSREDRHDHRDLSDGRSSHDINSMTVLAFTLNEDNSLHARLVDVELKTPAVGEGSMTISYPCEFELGRFNLHEIACRSGTTQRGCARLFISSCWSALNGSLPVALSVNSGEGGSTVTACTDLQIGGDAHSWDSLRGRLCTIVSNTCIKIRDYV